MGNTPINGTVAPGFEAVRDAFEQNFRGADEGGSDDVGASVALTVDGEMVVDLWGGTATFDSGPADWQEDTIINVWSTTKTMAALSLPDPRRPRRARPRTHRSPRTGPSSRRTARRPSRSRHLHRPHRRAVGLGRADDAEDIYDWDKLVGCLAAQAPWWEPGTRLGYHAIRQGLPDR